MLPSSGVWALVLLGVVILVVVMLSGCVYPYGGEGGYRHGGGGQYHNHWSVDE